MTIVGKATIKPSPEASKEFFGWAYHGEGHKYAQAYGMFFLAGLVTFIAVSGILLRARRLAETETTEDTNEGDP